MRIDPKELDQLEAAESDALDILEFVPLSAVDPIYFENTYYLAVEKQGEKALCANCPGQAMTEKQRVALAKFVWRGKESLYTSRSVEGRLLLHRMHYQDKSREWAAPPKGGQPPSAAELKLATQLIESISSTTFDAKAYHDEYRNRVMEVIEKRSRGKTLTLQSRTAKAATNVVDLMQRLKDSVAQTTQKKGARAHIHRRSQYGHLPQDGTDEIGEALESLTQRHQ